MALDPNWTAIISTIVGAALTISVAVATTIATTFLNNRDSNKLAKTRRERLRGMLSGEKYTWRSLQQLSASIGADEQTTTQLLIEIDARASFSNPRPHGL